MNKKTTGNQLDNDISSATDKGKNAQEKRFILTHRNESPTELALQAARYPDFDMPFVINQIEGWQTARKKLPTWAAIDDIIYPPHLSLEQCSSEQTARYKASLVSRLIGIQPVACGHSQTTESQNRNEGTDCRPVLTDLTGGLGVDFSFMARGLRATYVEQQPHLCQIARNNFRLLDLKQAEIIDGDGTNFLHELEFSTIIYLDPARRDNNGTKTVAIGDCTPNLLEIKDELVEKSKYVIVKLSPMLDWHKALEEINESADIVREIHIVAVRNECKELLFVMGKRQDPLRLYCVNDDETFTVELKNDAGNQETGLQQEINIGNFLYEPNAAIMKAGCFEKLSVKYGEGFLSHNSHLFISADEIDDFPGRSFKIECISSLNKKELKKNLKGIEAANITTRNFPISVAELRKKLKVKEGGENYIFATSDAKNNHLLLVCKKTKRR